MGKDVQPPRRQTNRNNQPYDASNSRFSSIRKVASQVTGYFGSFFTSGDSSQNSNAEESATSNEQAPPAPIPRSNFNLARDYSSTNHFSSSSVFPLFAPQPLETSVLRPRYEPATDLGVPGPSGVQRAGPSTSSTVADSGPIFGKRLPATRRSDLDAPVDPPAPQPLPTQQPPPPATPRFGMVVLPDDRSETSESTSGCSSLVPQADRLSQSAMPSTSRRKTSMALDEKLSYARQLQQSRSNFYLNRSIPANMEGARTSRTPGFDVSAFGSPIFNKSNVRESMLSSPFYTGHTTYGGAAARRSSIGITPSRPIPVKPAPSKESLNMSRTARQILAALEEFSSPISDARRVPAPAPLAAKRRAVEAASAPTAPKRPALVVPTVADLLKMRRLEKMQSSTAAARLVARKASKVVSVSKGSSDAAQTAPPVLPELDLPSVPLPISSLPKFDLRPPAPTFTFTRTSAEVRTPPVVTSVSTTSISTQFTFSPPAVVSTTAAPSRSTDTTTTTLSLPCPLFSFAPPQPVSSLPLPVSSQSTNSKNSKTVNASAYATVTAERDGVPTAAASKKKTNDSPVLPALSSDLKTTGSVMDVLGRSVSRAVEQRTSNTPQSSPVSSKTPSGDDSSKSWKCQSCLVSNASSADICKACDGTRSSKKEGVSATKLSNCDTGRGDLKKEAATLDFGFGNKFKAPAGSWSCSTCMISNSADAEKCLACEMPKTVSSKPSASGSGFLFCGETWSCKKCSLKNDVSAVSCSSCKTSKETVPPLNFGDKFKPPTGSWSCSCCLVSNPATVDKCVACETAKTGNAPQSNKQLDLFQGSSGSTLSKQNPCDSSSSGFGDKFKPAAGSWSCSTCMISNAESSAKCVACETSKPGSAPAKPQSLGFGDKFKPAPGTWTCSGCDLRNAATYVKCPACDTPNASALATTNGPKSSKWSCTVCLKSNPDGESCSACGTARPAASEDEGPKVNSIFGLPPAGAFKFGIDQSDAVSKPLSNGPAKPFLFSTAKSDAAASFSFGIPATSTPIDSNKKAADAPAAKKPEEDSSMDTISPTKTEPPAVAQSWAKSMFPPTSPTKSMFPPASTTKSMFPPASTTTAASPFGFNGTVLPKPVDVNVAVKPSATTFGIPPVATTTAAISFSAPSLFSTTANTFAPPKPEPPKPTGVFSFGGNTNATANPSPFAIQAQPTVAQPAAPTLFPGQATPSSGTFTFGAPSSNPPPSSGSLFGGLMNNTGAFGSTQAAPSPFGITSPSSNAIGFGAPSAAPAFGQSSAPATFAPQTFQFGAASGATPAVAATPAFSAPAASAPIAFPSSTSFSVNVPSTFNFTGGQAPSFSATPSTTTQEPRRVIRAVRRKR